MRPLNTQCHHSFIPRFTRYKMLVCFCLSMHLLSSSCGELTELNIETACIESPIETLDEDLREIQSGDQIAGYWHLHVDQIDAICSENQDRESQQSIVAIDSALIIIETYDDSIWLAMGKEPSRKSGTWRVGELLSISFPIDFNSDSSLELEPANRLTLSVIDLISNDEPKQMTGRMILTNGDDETPTYIGQFTLTELSGESH